MQGDITSALLEAGADGKFVCAYPENMTSWQYVCSSGTAATVQVLQSNSTGGDINLPGGWCVDLR